MISRDLRVTVPPARAWRAWVVHIDLWWPQGHRRFGESRLSLEPGVGGRLVETAADGQEALFGVVVGWEPPTRLAYDFFPGSSPEHPTRVVVTFAEEGEGTRVEVRHSLGAMPPEQWAQRNVRFAQRWDHLLPHFPPTELP